MTPYVFTPRRIRAFWAKVDTTGGLFACWPWLGAVDRWGYGRFSVGSREIGAHRAAYLIANGSIAEGMHALHTCDVGLCCNASHLYEGTQAQNMADRSERGRTWIGRAGRPVGTLTAAAVAQLRAVRQDEIGELAAKLGVHERTAQDAAFGRTWARTVGVAPLVVTTTQPSRPPGRGGTRGHPRSSVSHLDRGAALATQPA